MPPGMPGRAVQHSTGIPFEHLSGRSSGNTAGRHGTDDRAAKAWSTYCTSKAAGFPTEQQRMAGGAHGALCQYNESVHGSMAITIRKSDEEFSFVSDYLVGNVTTERVAFLIAEFDE